MRERQMMVVRWRKFTFVHQIPISTQKTGDTMRLLFCKAVTWLICTDNSTLPVFMESVQLFTTWPQDTAGWFPQSVVVMYATVYTVYTHGLHLENALSFCLHYVFYFYKICNRCTQIVYIGCTSLKYTKSCVVAEKFKSLYSLHFQRRKDLGHVTFDTKHFVNLGVFSHYSY